MRGKEIFVGSSGRGSTGHVIPAIARALLDLKVRIVAGFEGSRDAILAMERGEVDSAVQNWQVWMQGRLKWFEPGGTAADRKSTRLNSSHRT